MQTYHISRTLGRSIPGAFQTQDILIRQISCSAQHAQEPRQDSQTANREQQKDITQRVIHYFRRTNSVADVERPRPGLYYRHLKLNAVDAGDLAAPPNSASRPPRRTTDGDRASALRSPLDARSLGSQRPEHRPTHSFDSRSQPVRDSRDAQGPRILPRVDASDLAAPPNSASRPSRRTTDGDRASALRSPLDARSLGPQRPENGPTHSFDLRSEPVRDSHDAQGPRILPRVDASDRQFQGGTTSSQHNRSHGPSGTNSRKPRSGGSTRPKKPDRTSRSGFTRGSRSEEVGDKPTEEEIAYLKSRDSISDYSNLIFEGGAKKHINQVHHTYMPRDQSLGTLQGMGPALACGEWGMNETIGERLIQVNRKQDEYDERIEELAQKIGEGDFCHFTSKQERADTMKTVERNLAGQGENAKLDEEQETEKMALMDARMAEERAKLATRLLKGDYYVGPLGKGPTAELLERYTQKNETYMPKDSQALAGKIRTLLPLDRATTQDGAART
ncbi:MAG: hypothetical protein L6R36_003699 [Xanthoria steineri]|nr:MAG: hypothetical protein L6R36_003699 [Xanthoria steineri]